MAQKIAAHLEIPFITLDLEKQYKKEVILPMFKSYSNGLTPNPDVACNTIIKFPWLLKEAQKKGLDFIATGHYVRVKKTKQGYDLLQGKDNNKDQSYFLYELNQSILQHCLFPIGNLKKEEVREIARKQEFPNWNKHGTSGICFVGKVNIKSFLEKKIKNKPGPILDQNGKVIGKHPGVFYYTIGQRAGSHLGLLYQKPKEDNKKWYIAEKLKNKLIIAPEGHKILKKSKIIIKALHLVNPKEKIPGQLNGRIRHLGNLLAGKLKKNGNSYIFTLKTPAFGIAEGQHLVLYNKNKVIGGGEIRL